MFANLAEQHGRWMGPNADHPLPDVLDSIGRARSKLYIITEYCRIQNLTSKAFTKDAASHVSDFPLLKALRWQTVLNGPPVI